VKDNYQKDESGEKGKCRDCTGRHHKPENYLYRCGDCIHLKDRFELAFRQEDRHALDKTHL